MLNVAMENNFNGKNRSSPQKRQQQSHYSNGYSSHSSEQGGGAIMESLDPSLVGNDIEKEMASAGILSINPKNKQNQDIRNFPHNERSNMNSSTNSFGSTGKPLGPKFIFNYLFKLKSLFTNVLLY